MLPNPQPSRPTWFLGAPAAALFMVPPPGCDECGAEVGDHCTVCGACPDEVCSRIVRHEREHA